MLREMVVEEALAAMEEGREVRSFTLSEIADYVGVGVASIQREERVALEKAKANMVK